MQKINNLDNGHIDYKSELLRKSIHLCSLSIPVVYYFITKELALTVLISLLAFCLIVELGRFYIKPVRELFNKYFGFMLRKHEIDSQKKNLSGATYVILGAVLTVAIFPKVIVISAFTVLILGDIAAALLGRKFGKHKFLAKSLEGTLAFFITGIIIVIFTPKIEGIALEYLIGIIAMAVGAIVENLSGGWLDDNLTIPLSVGLSMWLLYSAILPNMQLILQNVPL